jgi:hypothetical protein
MDGPSAQQSHKYGGLGQILELARQGIAIDALPVDLRDAGDGGVNDHLPDRVSDVWIEKDERGMLTGIFHGAVNNYYNIDPYWTQILTKLPSPASWELHDNIDGVRAPHCRG